MKLIEIKFSRPNCHNIIDRDLHLNPFSKLFIQSAQKIFRWNKFTFCLGFKRKEKKKNVQLHDLLMNTIYEKTKTHKKVFKNATVVQKNKY